MKRFVSVFLTILMFLSISILQKPAAAVGESGAVAVGWGTTFYIAKDGALYGFGKNAEGLIPGGADTVEEPLMILSDAKSVCVNRYAVLVVKRDGSLWYWGRIGSLTAAQPTRLRENVASVAIEAYYSSILLVADTDGKLYELNKTVLEQVSHAFEVKFVAVGGSNHFFINENDELWGWTDNKNGDDSGALGVGHGEPTASPVKIMDAVQHVASYNSNTLIIRKDGTLWACGSGKNGKVYTVDGLMSGPLLSPVKVMDNVLHAAVYDSRFVAVKRDNTMWVWGTNVLGSEADQPVQVAEGVLYATISGHIAAIKNDNSLWTGGSKDGVYRADQASRNALRLTTTDLLDSPAAWAMAEVREAEWRKLVPPDMQSEYTKTVTRSEFCTLAIICIEQVKQMTIEQYLTAKGIALPTSTPFTDIASLSERARNDILAAYALEIVSGTSATTFEPSNPITREQAAKMLTATAYALEESTDAIMPTFSDSDSIGAWAKPYIGYVFNANIMSGVGDNRFDAKAGYQRQQAYMTVLRLYKNVTVID